ncbi:endospore germination permease [Paenibacillus sp. MMS20-IR301]|uniref:GerAB/ArcD/ProY family transporter n=1 Tax=Paenibacillus sp. MMS20-IR301 TaxID=2895946 RepID=UPI0028E2FBAA|nr:endospore germination permease [Paenibacillus sp. MMS20-IR301]WNS45998.1 endospore germination permease [Paenibacillus sp. MMS20-IR301]
MKITNRQLFWMIMMMEIGINLLISMTATILYAKQDAWISYILASTGGLTITFIAASLSSRHPRQTLIEFSVSILGKWAGKLIVIPFLLQWFWVMSLILRDEFLFIRLSVLYKTPSWVVIGTMIGVVFYTVYHGGIEAVGKVSELWGPILMLILALTFGLTFNNLSWQMLLPVYADTGPGPILEAALAPTSLLGEAVSLMMLFPFVEHPGKGTRKALLLGVAISSFLLLLGVVWVVMTFGPAVSGRLQFPFFEMVKLVYLMEFIQNMDIFVMAVWLVCIFVKLSIYMFITSYGVAQWIGKTGIWKQTLGYVAPLTFILTMVVIIMNPPAGLLLKGIWIRYVLPVNMVAIPLFLWMVSVVKGRRKKSRRA